MKVVVIDYNAGNTRSVYHALHRFGVDADFTRNHQKIKDAEKIIFPGVGEASTTMSFIREFGLDQIIPDLKQPFLGICLGMQLMCRWSEENDTDCLGIFDVDVKRFQPNNGEKVPHMGWNQIYNLDGALFDEQLENQFVYFVHSYYVPPTSYGSAETDYCQPFTSAIQKENFYATQFHPEKSGKVGARILQNFLALK